MHVVSLDVQEQFLPLGEVGLQPAVDVGWLHVPQTLVLQPHLQTHRQKSTHFTSKFKLYFFTHTQLAHSSIILTTTFTKTVIYSMYKPICTFT